MSGRARSAPLEGFPARPDHDAQGHGVCQAGQHGMLRRLGGGSSVGEQHPKRGFVQMSPQRRGLVVHGQADQLMAERGPTLPPSVISPAPTSASRARAASGAASSATSAATSGRNRRPARSPPAGRPPPDRRLRRSGKGAGGTPMSRSSPPARSGNAWPAASSAATCASSNGFPAQAATAVSRSDGRACSPSRAVSSGDRGPVGKGKKSLHASPTLAGPIPLPPGPCRPATAERSRAERPVGSGAVGT